MVDQVLAGLSPRFNPIDSNYGRPSIAPEKLLRPLRLQMLYSARSSCGDSSPRSPSTPMAPGASSPLRTAAWFLNERAGGPRRTIKDDSIQAIGWVQPAGGGMESCRLKVTPPPPPASFRCSGWTGEELERIQAWRSEEEFQWASHRPRGGASGWSVDRGVASRTSWCRE